MLIVGELINTSRREIHEAVKSQDADYIKKIAWQQAEAGADYIDVNCSTLIDNEAENMAWLVRTIQESVHIPLCLDSMAAKVIEAGLKLAKYGQPMINSITAETENFEQILPLVLKYNAKVVALCIDDNGMPVTVMERMIIAGNLFKNLKKAGVPEDNMFFDPLVKPISVSDQEGSYVLDTVRLISQEYPKVHKICGLSNISYGMPNRQFLNRLFMAQTMAAGMDSYILNPLDGLLMGSVYGAKALTGNDPFCMGYLTAHRQKLYDFT